MLASSGKKTKEWETIRKQLKKEFAENGITSCEVKRPQCWKNNALSFAHLDKRRYLSSKELKIVVLACVPCHQELEHWPREKMRTYLQNIIDSRIKIHAWN